jgi:alpha-ketoglutarate-dependent taurine dioxygenase
MTQPSDALKPIANRLAEVLAGQAGARTLSLMQSLGIGTPRPPADDQPRNGNGAVGIWHPLGERGRCAYVRREDEPWWLWADVPRIPPKSGRKRVVLLGESVARGFFYDPLFNPAEALRTQLAAGGAGEFEVVDLARIDQGRESLLRLAAAAQALEPDALVILAGNNWRGHHELGPAARAELASLLRAGGGPPAAKAFMEQRLAEVATAFVDTLAELCAAAGIPAVLMVPEFNLVDWSGHRREAPCVGARDFERWVRLRDAAEEALAQERLEDAYAHAMELASIDQGTSAIGPAVLGECHLRRREPGRARPFLEAARDAEVWAPVQVTPRCYTAVQRALRAAGARRGLAVVDLPWLFEDWQGGRLPGRDLFHDYCHLTVEGMQVAMAGAGEALLQRVWGMERGWRALAAVPLGVPAPLRGRAHLLAAVHNDSWDQPCDIISHHCQEAAHTDPELAAPMALIAEFCVRRTSTPLTSAFHDLYARGELPLARFWTDVRPLTRQKLVRALVAATRVADSGLEGRLLALRQAEHGVEAAPLDLLEPWYSRGSLNQLDGMAGGAAFHRCFAQASRFLLWTRLAGAITFRLTCRAPAAGAATARVRLNGAEVAEVPLTSRWRTAEFEGRTVPGENEVTIEWPPPAGTDGTLLRAIERIELGLPPEPYPVHGEIFAFLAEAGRSGQSATRTPARGRKLSPAGALPLVVTAPPGPPALAGWIARERDVLEEALDRHGALLFRGFDLLDAEGLAAVVRAFGGEPLPYRERSSPRRAVGSNVYTSTEYPPSQAILLHNENSYQQCWPARLFFLARRPAARGGQTPLADTRRVLRHIAPEVRRRFAERGVLYVRNYGYLGLTWPQVFQTHERREVEAYCRAAGITWEWIGRDFLRTTQVRPAVARHPRTGELAWFNHAVFFHASSLPPAFREDLRTLEVPETEMPHLTYYGDGTPIEPAVLDALREAYRQETVQFTWHRGDLLVVDNIAAAHGREPFEGEREVLVAMAGTVDWSQVEARPEEVS